MLLTYLLGVVASSLVGGLLPAVLTSVVASVLANWYFTPPYGELTISQPVKAKKVSAEACSTGTQPCGASG